MDAAPDGLFLAGHFQPAPFQLSGVASKRVGLGEKSDNVAIEVRVDHGECLRLGAIEGQHRLFDSHARYQHDIGVAKELFKRSLGIDFAGVSFGREDHAGITAALIDHDDRGRPDAPARDASAGPLGST